MSYEPIFVHNTCNNNTQEAALAILPLTNAPSVGGASFT